ncbi:MAG: Hsp70 family protein [Anaerolineaceae bacterium]|nr:Hsp70 family protein [Anaerolineaceae bacterium]
MIIGMDFGTTNSGMAVYENGALRLIPLDPMNANPHVARTALYITNDRAVYIGRDAINTYYDQNLNRPSRYERVRVGDIELTFGEIGTFIRDVFIEKDIYSPGRLFLSFKMGLSSTTYLGTIIGSHYYFLEDIIAIYLYTARQRAQTFLDTEVDTIVLGRPVRFSDDPVHNDLARERLLQAAFRAGFQRVYLQYEPIAAAHYYETTINNEQHVLIFDFGGGTLDISILRLGNPKTRRVLATGGIPIAGDVFDRKIVRAKLPPHFGEGGTYRLANQDLPMPSSYYEAFANWQELMLLQRTESLEKLQQIEITAHQPLKLRALVNLITSHYGLKMYDMAEGVKRKLSKQPHTSIQFDGPGFAVRDRLTRAEFEHLIRSDIRAISARLDGVLDEAGLAPGQIDAVIRTGGSSQIPAFIDLLETRFGADKVRELDAFSSVTAGLGIIAHQIKSGELDLPLYTPDSRRGGDYLNSKTQGGVPVVDINLMKKLVELREQGAVNDRRIPIIVAGMERGQLAAVPHSEAGEHRLNTIGIPDDVTTPVAAFAPDERVVLMTTEYRYLTRSAGELSNLFATSVDLTKLEGFQRDSFGQETVCALAPWSSLEDATSIVTLNTRGYARAIPAETLLSRLGQTIPYQMERGKGFPAALLGVNGTGDGDIIAISHAGRGVRVAARNLSPLEARLFQLPPASDLIGAFYLDEPGEILIATTAGYMQRVLSSDIPHLPLNTTGEKLIARSNPAAAIRLQPGRPVWALTNRRLIPVDPTAVPLLPPAATGTFKAFRPQRGDKEFLIGLF